LVKEVRKEYKLIATEAEVSNFSALNKKDLATIYPTRKVKSLYFDTLNYDLYKRSKFMDTDRYKIRVRTYSSDKNLYKEIKFNLQTGKDKYVEKLSFGSLSEIKEINYKGKTYLPAAFTEYERSYFSFKSARITIDRNIKFTSHQFRTLFKNVKFFEKVIVEYKNMPGLNEVEKYLEKNPVSFSKYNTAIEKLYFYNEK